MLKGKVKTDAPTVTQDVRGSGAGGTKHADVPLKPKSKPNVPTPPMKGTTPPPTPSVRDLIMKLNNMEQSQLDSEKKIMQASRTMKDMQSEIEEQAKVTSEHHSSADNAIAALETYT